MRSNPHIVLFSYRKRQQQPEITNELRSTIRREMKKQPEGVRLPSGELKLRWQDLKGRWAKFTRKRKLRGLLILAAKKKRLSPKMRLSLQRRRQASQRRSLKRWMARASEIFRRLTLFLQNKPQRFPPVDSRIYKWFADFNDEVEDVYEDEGWEGLVYLCDDEGSIWKKRFAERRQQAVALGGAATDLLPELEQRIREYESALGEEAPPTDWLSLAPWAHSVIAQAPFNLSRGVWDREVHHVERGSKGSQVWGAVRPMEVVHLYEGDHLRHPAGSANLLILDESLPPESLDDYRAEKYVMMVLCRFTKAQDHLLDDHQSFTSSPVMDDRKPLSHFRNSPEGRYTVLAAPANYIPKRKEGKLPKSFREMHDWLFTKTRSSKGAAEYESYIVGARAFYRREDAEREVKRLGQRVVYASAAKKGEKATIVEGMVESGKFMGQEVWKDLFHRTWWRKGVYAIPVMFLGYTPRGGRKMTGAAG